MPCYRLPNIRLNTNNQWPSWIAWHQLDGFTSFNHLQNLAIVTPNNFVCCVNRDSVYHCLLSNPRIATRREAMRKMHAWFLGNFNLSSPKYSLHEKKCLVTAYNFAPKLRFQLTSIQALLVHAVFGAVDEQFVFSMLVHCEKEFEFTFLKTYHLENISTWFKHISQIVFFFLIRDGQKYSVFLAKLVSVVWHQNTHIY